MPITNNVALLNAYDHADAITVEALGGVSSPSLHHAVHCLSFEILRGWTAVGLDAYNDEAAYATLAPQIVEEAIARISLNPASAELASRLTVSDKAIAQQQGENYYEHGYVTILAGVDANAKRTFYRDSTVSDR